MTKPRVICSRKWPAPVEAELKQRFDVTLNEADVALTADEFNAMVEPEQPESAMPRMRDEQAEARQNLWQYGLLLMLGALVAESFVGRRG